MNLTLCPECGEDVLLIQYDFHLDMCYACAKEMEIELSELEPEDDDYFHPSDIYDKDDE